VTGRKSTALALTFGGDYDQIIKSIKDRLMVLDDGTTVIPGHGEFTRIFDEKRTNPFL
jgi:glyoxylase-like metal-dependent hydrolase (beta-lactamase superfamily II)